MVRTQALMEAESANLNWFLQPIGENLTKPQKKFLRDGLTGPGWAPPEAASMAPQSLLAVLSSS